MYAYARCEPWLTIFVLVGLEGRLNDTETAKHIVNSIECRIDGEQEPSLEVPVALPARYGVAVNPDAVTYVSTTGAIVVTNYTQGDIARDQRILPQIYRGMIQTFAGGSADLQVETTPVTRRDGARSVRSHLTGQLGDLGEEAHIGTLFCERLELTMMMIIAGKGDPGMSPDELVRALRCPDEKNLPAPARPISEVFADACTRGEAQACADLAGLIDDGSASTDKGSASTFRQSACELGLKDQCS